MIPLSSLITITEEGEAIGTLRQFACSFDLSLSGLLHALDTTARDCVIFRAGTDPDRLLILDGCGLPALFAASPMAQ
jgi:hypothetical protein